MKITGITFTNAGPLVGPLRVSFTYGRETEMKMHSSTFEYLKPTDAQMMSMGHARKAAADFAARLDPLIPDGPDKTYIMRKLRELAMWVNVAITRDADGSPRE